MAAMSDVPANDSGQPEHSEPHEPDDQSIASATVNDEKHTAINDLMGTAITALLESNRMIQASLLNCETRRHKVYVPMPDKFDGKVGDYIDGWLEQFETWF